jgi:hypothetical protein
MPLLSSRRIPVFYPGDREQLQPQITDLGENPVECGLVRDGTGEGGFAVGVLGDGHVVEPVVPPGAQMALDANLVQRRPIWSAIRLWCV